MTNNITWKGQIKQILIDILASVSLAIGINIFAAPNGIAPGGVSGIAVILNYLFDLPIGTVSLCINIPLLILAWKVKGKDFTIKTLRTLICYMIVSDVFFVKLPFTFEGDIMMSIIYGGVFSGFATALVFSQGGTLGGTDILNRVLQLKYPYISTGQLSLGMNAIVMCLAAIVYRNLNAALYGLVYSFVASKIMDSLLNGLDMGKCVMIITHKPDEISKHIIEELHRTATVIDGKGAYLKDDTTVLLCVVRKPQFYQLKKFVAAIDPKAFVIITEATQIIGAGFKPIDSEN